MQKSKIRSLPATASLATEAASRGLRAPIQLIANTGAERGWLLVARDGDQVYADTYGDLWWAKPSGAFAARIVRAVWPEEASSLSGEIEAGVAAIVHG